MTIETRQVTNQRPRMSVLRLLNASACALLLSVLSVVATAGPALAAIGYEPDPSQPAISLGSQYPHGIAVDQENGRIYVAVVSANMSADADGVVDQLESNGTASANSPFIGGTYAFFSGVAVDPLTGGIYASQVAPPELGRYIGETKMDLYSSTGVSEGSFQLTTSHEVAPQIATNSSGDVFYPNDGTGTVQVFSPLGGLEGEISCASCPGGHFVTPVSVAINGSGDLYVVDLGSERVVELAPSEGSYSYLATLQSGEGAVAVGVDPGLEDVFVGDVAPGGVYHIVAYDSAGTQFDDFGAGLFATVEHPGLAWQIAANASTHLLYATDEGSILVFHQASIGAPQVSRVPPAPVGQITATLNAKLDAEGHAVLSCEIEYAEAADSSYVDPKTAPCSTLPAGKADTAISANVSSLLPSTSYRYRILAENNGGSVTGGEEVFETLPALPATVGVEAAAEMTQTGGTLSAEVNPEGGSVSGCYFEYGQTAAYGTRTACPHPVKPVTTGVPETLKVADLAASTHYDFRVVVSTNAGTTEGANVQFTTLAEPPTLLSEPGPGLSSQPPTTEAESGSHAIASPTPPSHAQPSSPAPAKKSCASSKSHKQSRCAKQKKKKKKKKKQKNARHKGTTACGRSDQRQKSKCSKSGGA